MIRRTLILCVLILLALGVQAAQAAYVTVHEDASGFTLTTNLLTITVPKANAVISVWDGSGNLIAAEKIGYSYKVSGVYYWVTTADSYSVSGDTVTINCSTSEPGRSLSINFEFMSARAFYVDYRVSAGNYIELSRVIFSQAENEYCYGLGEPRTNALSFKGQAGDIWVTAGYPDETNLVPFFVSNKGYGVFVDSYAGGTVDASDPTQVKLIWDTRQMSYFFFYGPSIAEVVSQYTTLTGLPPMPPKWVLGLSKWLPATGADQAAVLADAQRFVDNDIPASMIWIDPQWQTGLNTFTFRTDIFPDPQGLMNQLHGLGFKVAAWMTPFNDEFSPTYMDAFNAGYYVMDSTGAPWVRTYNHYDYFLGTSQPANQSFIDFTDELAVAWWRTQLAKATAYGFDGFKIDRGQEITDGCQFENGQSGRTMHNRYAYYVAKVHHDFLSDTIGGESALILKSGTQGSQAYTTLLWSGDQPGDFSVQGLPGAVRAGLNAGLSGFPYWTSDIGGWRTTPFKENYLRWAAFSAFTPAMETPYGPWLFDQQTVDIFRSYAKLHYEILPFIYSLAHQAHVTGQPIMRPLVYDYVGDAAVANNDTQYLLGRQFLVAPVLQSGVQSRNVYLPQGYWIDYWDTSKTYSGPTTLNVSTPIDKIPVFVKGGAIIPMEIPGSTSTVILDTYPWGRSSFKVYMDGQMANIYSRYYGNQLSYRIEALPRNVVIKAFIGAGMPAVVKLNGSNLTKYASEAELNAASQGWYWASAERRMYVKYPANTEASVDVSW